MMARTRSVPVLVASVALVLGTFGTAVAKPGGGQGGSGGGGGGSTPSAAIVSLGDSYISGEAGRWAGNSLDDSGDRAGTDRARYRSKGTWYQDLSLVYLEGTDADGCHRSDVADVHSAAISGLASINLACSGAVSSNVFRSSNGGQSQNGWAPQADQLAALPADLDVTMIVLSIGGNDLGFADIIIACTEDWFSSPSWWENHCRDEQQDNVDARMPGAMAGVSKAIDEIQAVMATRGDADYRLVLRSYSSPIPRGSENRYSESGWSRWDSGGCPFWNEDSDWARDSLVPQIADNLAVVAAAQGVEFLDVRDLLQGHEVCSVHTAHVTSSPDGASAEWVRWLNTGFGQGDAQESMHPNAFGQQAAGACIAALYAATPGDHTCTSTVGAGPGAVSLSAG